MVNFGDRLKQARETKGLTQQALAEQLFVTRQTVSRWENGTRYPDLMTTKLLANLLGVTIDSLVSEAEMQTYSEKQKYAEQHRYSKIMTALYAIIGVCALLRWVPALIEIIIECVLFIKSDAPLHIDGVFLLTDHLTMILSYIAISAIAVIAFYNAVKKSISPKMTGLIGIVFVGSLAIHNLVVMLFRSVYWQGTELFLIEAVFAVLIGLTLIGNFKRFSIAIYVGCSLFAIYFSVSPFFKLYAFLQNNFLSELSLSALFDFSRMIMSIAVMALIVIATAAQHRRSRCFFE